MPSCRDMKKGDIYVCEDCGLEIKVVKECRDAGKPSSECACHDETAEHTLSCCGKHFVKKQR